MPVTRVPSLLEQSIITKNSGLDDEVRTQLGCASAADVSASLIPISSQIAAISGVNIGQAAQIAAISGSYTPLTLTNTVSANLATDIANLDLSLTQSVVTLFDTSGSSALTPSTIVAVPTSASGWIQLSCNGTNIKIPFWIA